MLWLLACTSPPLDTGWALPALTDLEAQEAPPAPLVSFQSGTTIESVQDWEADRRPELLRLFERYVYGPPGDLPESALQEARLLDARTVELVADTHTVLVWLPEGEGPFPLLLGLNKCGNASTTSRTDVTLPTGWLEPTCDPERGSRADSWSVEEALSAGVAVATVHQSDFAPDDRGQVDEALIATWSAGLSVALDTVAQSDLPIGTLALFGHSRRGKAALWCAAQDERVDVVFPHQSGTAGQALSRGSTGETVEDITTLFPHWFTPDFAWFAGQEALLPVDQHLLLALVAPREVHARDGDDDAWANPPGAEQATALAQPVFELVGGRATWSHRPGDHAVTREDWVAWAAALSGR